MFTRSVRPPVPSLQPAAPQRHEHHRRFRGRPAQPGEGGLKDLAAQNAFRIAELAVPPAREGQSLAEAALSAATLRFRPSVMTFLAFPLGTGVIGGMLGAPLLAPLCIPAFRKRIIALGPLFRSKVKELG